MSWAQFSALVPAWGCLQTRFPAPNVLLSYFATPPSPFPALPFPERGLELKEGFASSQRWWMLSKPIPARMLQPRWGYQGTAGPG